MILVPQSWDSLTSRCHQKRRRELEKASVNRSEAIGHGKHMGPKQKLIASGSSQLQPYLLSQITEHMRTRIPIFGTRAIPSTLRLAKQKPEYRSLGLDHTNKSWIVSCLPYHADPLGSCELLIRNLFVPYHTDYIQSSQRLSNNAGVAKKDQQRARTAANIPLQNCSFLHQKQKSSTVLHFQPKILACFLPQSSPFSY